MENRFAGRCLMLDAFSLISRLFDGMHHLEHHSYIIS
jgi:hypothetical protein